MGRTKKKRSNKSYEPTKGQLSRWEKQKRRQRIIGIVGGVIIIAVVLILGIGLYTQWYEPVYKPMQETVYQINEHEVKMSYFVDALQYYSGYVSTNVQYFVDYTENAIKDILLRIDSAEQLGYEVAQEEVEAIIEENGLRDNQAVRDVIEAALVGQELREGYFDPKVARTEQQRNVWTAFLESEEVALEFADRYDQGEDFTLLVEEYSLDEATIEDGGDLGWHSQFVLEYIIGNEDFAAKAFEIEIGQFGAIKDEDKVRNLGYWVIEVVEINEENGERRVRAILLSSEDEAIRIIGKIEAGENFADLAEQYSELDVNLIIPGDLGLVEPGTYGDAFDSFVFDEDTLEDVLSGPTKDSEVITEGGYWLILAMEENLDKVVSDDDKGIYINDLYQSWLESLADISSNEIVDNITEEMRQFAIDQAMQ